MPKAIAQVVPLRRFQRSKGVFDYIVSPALELTAGDLVEVPFLRSKLPALVIGTAQTSSLRPLRAVERIIYRQLITQEQRQLMNWLADYSYVSLATAAKLFVPPLPIAAGRLWPTSSRQSGDLKPVNISLGTDGQEKMVVRELLKKVQERREQALVLVPEVYLTDYWSRLLDDFKPAVIHGELPNTVRRQLWFKVRVGEIKLIIGTQSALWLPYVNLGSLIITQAESDSYWRGEQNPRYDALMVARKLARLNGASLASLSVAPRVEQWYNSTIGQEKWRSLPRRRRAIILCNLTHRAARETNILCAKLVKDIETILQRGGKVFLYLNKRGEASAQICRDCGYTPTCPTCERPLASAGSSSWLNCFQCGFTQVAIVPCPKCGGLEINYRGFGLSKLFREAERLWPWVNKCLLEGHLTEAVRQQAASAQLIIGNRTGLRALINQRIDLSVMVLPDIEISWPEFRASERLWQLLNQLRLNSKTLAVQTYRPEYYLWQALKFQSETAFYEQECKIRQAYSYPPYTRLTRFSLTASEPKLALHKAKLLKHKLWQAGVAKDSLIGPYPDYFLRRGKKCRYYLLLKYKSDLILKSLKSLLPDDVIVEPDPYFILS